MGYWTENERKFLIENYGKINTKLIAKKVKRSPATVRQQAILLGISKNKKDFKLQTGAVFGRWTVILETKNKTKDGSNKYLCKCRCGKQKEVRRVSLVNGDSQSCGCLVAEKVREAHSLEDGQTSFNNLYTICKGGARRRNLEFSLTKEEHRRMISKNCHYCNSLPIKYSRYESKIKSDIKKHLKVHITEVAVARSWIYVNTIDRMDSSKGYTMDNCVPACWDCNYMKMDCPYEKFISQVRKIVEFQKEKK